MNYKHELCYGTVIHPGYVLTAAHCVKYDMIAYIGDSPLSPNTADKWIQIEETYLHPNYTGIDSFDIAILKLSERPLIKVPIIPKEALVITHSQVTIARWGIVDPETNKLAERLQVTHTLEVVPTHVCEQLFPNLLEHQFCLYSPANSDVVASSNICKGDSGGPILLLDQYSNSGSFPQLDQLHGIIARVPNCTLADSISIGINVMHLRPWIDNVLEVSTAFQRDFQQDMSASDVKGRRVESPCTNLDAVGNLQEELRTMQIWRKKEIELLRKEITSWHSKVKALAAAILVFAIIVFIISLAFVLAPKMKEINGSEVLMQLIASRFNAIFEGPKLHNRISG